MVPVRLPSFSGHPICTDLVSVGEVSQVLFRLSRWENLEYAKKI